MQSVLDTIRSLPPLAAYSIIAALVFGEAAVFIGFVLPGETAVVFGGFLASIGRLDITTLCILVVVAAVVGDSVGYEVGRHFGPRVIGMRLFTSHQSRLDKAQRLLRERGGPAVLLGRFTAFFRAVMPGLAGLSRMHYGKFLVWNALGGLVWGIGFTLVGYFAGTSYDRVAKDIGRGTALAIAAVALCALVVWRIRQRNADEREEDEWEAAHQEEPLG